MKKTILICMAFGILPLNGDLSASIGKPAPPPEDTTIRILLIADSRISIATINLAKNYLLDAWEGTNFSTNPKPTTITLANGGTPLFVGHPYLWVTQTTSSTIFASL